MVEWLRKRTAISFTRGDNNFLYVDKTQPEKDLINIQSQSSNRNYQRVRYLYYFDIFKTYLKNVFHQ